MATGAAQRRQVHNSAVPFGETFSKIRPIAKCFLVKQSVAIVAVFRRKVPTACASLANQRAGYGRQKEPDQHGDMPALPAMSFCEGETSARLSRRPHRNGQTAWRRLTARGGLAIAIRAGEQTH